MSLSAKRWASVAIIIGLFVAAWYLVPGTANMVSETANTIRSSSEEAYSSISEAVGDESATEGNSETPLVISDDALIAPQ